jgi:hypothetical protein
MPLHGLRIVLVAPEVKSVTLYGMLRRHRTNDAEALCTYRGWEAGPININEALKREFPIYILTREQIRLGHEFVVATKTTSAIYPIEGREQLRRLRGRPYEQASCNERYS